MKTVSYLDIETNKIIQMPASQLAHGCVEIELIKEDGTSQIVWTEAKLALKIQSKVNHPPLSEELMVYVKQIHEAFLDFYPITLEEWETGFRCDLRPEKEIGYWLHAADRFKDLIKDEYDTERKKDIFSVLMACMNSSMKNVRYIIKAPSLSSEEIDNVIKTFYS